jgi:hypothetical protein
MKKYLMSLCAGIVLLSGCKTIDHNNQQAGNIDNNESSEPKMLNKNEIIETVDNEWYIRIVAEDVTNGMKTSGAQLGELSVPDATSKHTLKAIAPFGSTYLDVTFVDPEGVGAGEYKTNFHSQDGTKVDTWEFTVKSHDPNADIILSWRGLYVLSSYIDNENRKRYHEYRSMTHPLLAHMTLTDLTTGTTVNILSDGLAYEYPFNMNGATERVFQWRLDRSTDANTTQSNTVDANTKGMHQQKIRTLRKSAKASRNMIEHREPESFEMTSPPEFRVLAE